MKLRILVLIGLALAAGNADAFGRRNTVVGEAGEGDFSGYYGSAPVQEKHKLFQGHGSHGRGQGQARGGDQQIPWYMWFPDGQSLSMQPYFAISPTYQGPPQQPSPFPNWQTQQMPSYGPSSNYVPPTYAPSYNAPIHAPINPVNYQVPSYWYGR